MIMRLRKEDVEMGTKRKTITITDNQDDAWWEVDLDPRLVVAALIEGEESGEPQPFDAHQFKRAMTDKHG